MSPSWSAAPLRLGIAALVLGGGLFAAAPGAEANAKPPVQPVAQAECKSTPAVVIDAGTMTNTTNLDLSANGGTGVADASGGDTNVALPGNDGGTAAAGNGGGANAGANGGAIGVQDVNSGGNAGTGIAVGDTFDGNLCDGVPAVSVSGGEVVNETNISVSADGGTAIADASGGDNNVAANGGSAGNGGSISSVGNGGSANAAANGGAVSLGDINSGGNAGNVISVGDTVTGQPVPEKPVPVKPIPEKPIKPAPEKPVPVKPGKPVCCDKPGKVIVTPGRVDRPGRAPEVRAVPATGVGVAGAPAVGLAAGALAAAAGAVATRRRSL
jgi:hypothetical protein